LIEPLVSRSLRACRRAVRDAGIDIGEIDAVVMVGGSTRVPLVREQVARLFECQPLTDIDPDKVVSLGAAIQADILAGNQSGSSDLLLLDVNPLSLGLETMGELVEKIIPRNTTIPVSRTQDFTTARDGQTAMALHVVQGERELVSACRSLARFELRGIPPMVAGAAKIRVTFQVDADGLLSVTARETRSGVEAHVEVKPSYGLSDEEVSRMLEDSLEHAEDDRRARGLREQQVNAERLLETVQAALQADGDLLSEKERAEVDQQLEQLEQLSRTDDQGAIARQIQKVNQVTHEFASRRMDATVRRAFAGRQLKRFRSRKCHR
jgi:molecular chaperone HscA